MLSTNYNLPPLRTTHQAKASKQNYAMPNVLTSTNPIKYLQQNSFNEHSTPNYITTAAPPAIFASTYHPQQVPFLFTSPIHQHQQPTQLSNINYAGPINLPSPLTSDQLRMIPRPRTHSLGTASSASASIDPQRNSLPALINSSEMMNLSNLTHPVQQQQQPTQKTTKNGTKSITRKPISTAKRAAQNINAQKAFRQRKERYIKILELKSIKYDELVRENTCLREQMDALRNQLQNIRN